MLLWVISLPLAGALYPWVPPAFLPPQRGIASWYSESDARINRFTASGEIFDDTQATCASRDFPFGTYVKIVNIHNGKSVICRVNDHGPRRSLNRVIDLTKSSFQKIADPDLGLIEVTVTPVPDNV